MHFLAICILAASTVAAPAKYTRSPYIGAIAVDASNGRVLLADNERQPCLPASCTKLMTAYLALKAVKNGELKLLDRLVQSDVSFREKPSWLGIPVGKSISVADGLKALMVQSANDVAVMFAEKLAGSTADFVGRMNETAKNLGMTDTVFVSPNGYPPPKGSKRGYDRSTAQDLALLGRVIVNEYPEILNYTSIEKITIPGVITKQGGLLEMYNHNNLLVGDRKRGIAKMPEVDGLKTGYHIAGGCSLVLTGTRNDKRVIVVVVGSPSAKDRDTNAGRMLSDALNAIAW